MKASTSLRVFTLSGLVLASLATARTLNVQAAELPKALPKTVSASATPDKVKFFDDKVRPVLAQNCYKCHTTEEMGGLRLDSRAGMLKGGDSGPAIVPGDARQEPPHPGR